MSWLSKFFNFSKPERELFIVVYDTKQMTLSTPHLPKVQKALAEQKGLKTLSERVRSLIRMPNDTPAVIEDIIYFRKVANGNIERDYVFVSGYDLMFEGRLGRDFFPNKTEVFAAKFPSAAPHIEDMLEQHLPGHVLMRA